MRRVALLSVLLAGPSPAFAGIIGMLWSHAGNNVAVSVKVDAGRRVVRVEMPNEIPCRLQLYRHKQEELDGAKPQDGPQGKALGFGLWFDAPCYHHYFDQPQDKRPAAGPKEAEFDVDAELFGRPGLAGHRAAFDAGTLALAFCLQQSGSGDAEQGMTCAVASRADFDAGKVVYRSAFAPLKAVDLGLTAPRPLREDVVVAVAYFGPNAKAGEFIPRRPTLFANVRPFSLAVAQAYNANETVHPDGKYQRFYFHRGAVVDELGAVAAARRGEIVCELVLSQPRALVGVEKTIHIPATRVTGVGAGGGGTPWLYTPHENDPDIKNKRYWSQSISLQPSGSGILGPDTRITHVACMKPGWRDATNTVTAGELYDALRLGGQPLIELLTDFPADQKP
ncbi:MAG: hypothetical protein HY553_05010 [Elusimicrobia bacterium]|nr:hypothetical protein [Elusimicrobiota bacterium]